MLVIGDTVVSTFVKTWLNFIDGIIYFANSADIWTRVEEKRYSTSLIKSTIYS